MGRHRKNAEYTHIPGDGVTNDGSGYRDRRRMREFGQDAHDDEFGRADGERGEGRGEDRKRRRSAASWRDAPHARFAVAFVRPAQLHPDAGQEDEEQQAEDRRQDGRR
jgi:hypothetical protein